jgi:hypothetical protein
MNSSLKVHLPSLGMLLLSGGGAIIAVSSAVAMGLAGLLIMVSKDPSGPTTQSFFSLGTTSGLIFLLLLPSTILAGFRLVGASFPIWEVKHVYLISTSGLVLVPLAFGVGVFITRYPLVAEILLPFVQILVIGLPLVWLLALGTRGFNHGSPQRNWGFFSFCSTLSIPLIMVFEIAMIVILGIFGILGLKLIYPDLLQQLMNTIGRLTNSNRDTESVFRILRPYLSHPLVLVGGFAMTAGLVPLLEEALKPLALWFFANRRLSARDGFIGGLICGASFALLESLGAMASTSLETWPVIVIGRIGTGILHTTTSGLIGWGLGSAWSDGKYGRLAASYAAAVCFHGLWNIFALMSGMGQISRLIGFESKMLDSLILISPGVLILLSSLLISIIWRANSLLQLSGNKV